MTCIQVQFRALAQGQKPARQWRLALNSDQRLGTDQVAGRSEQRMATLNCSHLDRFDTLNSSFEQCRINDLNPAAISAKSLIFDNQ